MWHVLHFSFKLILFSFNTNAIIYRKDISKLQNRFILAFLLVILTQIISRFEFYSRNFQPFFGLCIGLFFGRHISQFFLPTFVQSYHHIWLQTRYPFFDRNNHLFFRRPTPPCGQWRSPQLSLATIGHFHRCLSLLL